MWQIASRLRHHIPVIALATSAACAARTADLAPDIGTVAAEPRDNADSSRHVVHVASAATFTLTAEDSRDFEIARDELSGASARFRDVFGEDPSRIDVHVGPPLNRDSAHTLIRDDVLQLATGAWLQKFTIDWCDDLGDGVALVDPPAEPLVCNGALPDWLALGAEELLVDPTAEQQAFTILDVPKIALAPLHALFRYQVGSDVQEGNEEVAFIAQSISVMRYLQVIEGPQVLADIARASSAGLSMPEILARLDKPLSVKALDAGYRAWLAERNVTP